PSPLASSFLRTVGAASISAAVSDSPPSVLSAPKRAKPAPPPGPPGPPGPRWGSCATMPAAANATSTTKGECCIIRQSYAIGDCRSVTNLWMGLLELDRFGLFLELRLVDAGDLFERREVGELAV